MEKTSYSTQRLDHLGIVAGICRQIGLIEQIDAFVGPTERNVSVGEASQAMIINALGFVGRPLYLTPEFFANKPVDLLISENLRADDFNDDSLGRALDCLYEAGLTECFAQVASHALRVFEIDHRFYHLDSTTFSLHGAYATPSEDPKAIVITHGHSKDHRPDLKQVVASLICTYRSAIPLWLEALDGNRADKKSFPETIQAYVAQIRASDPSYFIADSALYSAENIQTLSQLRWITRVPGTLKEVKQLYQAITPEQMQASSQEGYRYLELESLYGGVKQRWMVVFSERGYHREVATFRKKVAKKRTQAEKALRRLSQQEFADPEAAQAAVAALERQWRFHRAEVQLDAVPYYGQRGRPKQGQTPKRVGWRVVGCVVEKEEAITEALKEKGKFVLATNELDGERLPAETILTAYKGQGVSVERGFRFLKDPLFFASSLFLKRPERIMGLLMVMGLSLLVYALAERFVRTELKQRGETLPNQVGKPSQRPTMRRIFQVFEGIDVLLVQHSTVTQRLMLNLKPIHRQIIDLLGPDVKKCYFPKG